jgi:hypothetical protein
LNALVRIDSVLVQFVEIVQRLCANDPRNAAKSAAAIRPSWSSSHSKGAGEGVCAPDAEADNLFADPASG